MGSSVARTSVMVGCARFDMTWNALHLRYAWQRAPTARTVSVVTMMQRWWSAGLALVCTATLMLAACADPIRDDRRAVISAEPMWQHLVSVNLDPTLHHVVDERVRTVDASPTDVTYRLVANFGNYALVVYTAPPSTVGLVPLVPVTAGGGYTALQVLTVGVSAPPRAAFDRPRGGFLAALPGGPYAAASVARSPDQSSYKLYASNDTIVVVVLTPRPAVLPSTASSQPQTAARSLIETTDTSIAVENTPNGSIVVGVLGPKVHRDLIISLIDWELLERRLGEVSS